VFKEFHLTFEAGKKTAIVGPSGSGKSTLFQLIERFYDPQAGLIKLNEDETWLERMDLRQYRSQVAYVSQEPNIFNTTVRKNLQFASPEATDD
jgi:ABC-type multidrug transport system fused ATPase/permease subunit